eukprot:m.38550 g.38550  ORF g.38550 m.38550 type:complete len:59 (+) comp17935_c1_seq1:44-220(+)
MQLNPTTSNHIQPRPTSNHIAKDTSEHINPQGRNLKLHQRTKIAQPKKYQNTSLTIFS